MSTGPGTSRPCGLSRLLEGGSYSEGPRAPGPAYGGSQGSVGAAPPLVLTMGDVLCEELEDLVHFSVHDLPARGYVVMEEIRRQGKLCDVTLKVKGEPEAGASLLAKLT